MKLSIVTINLNNAIGLEKTLNSLQNQEDTNFELIVIDGKSTDASIEIAHKYSSIISKLISEKDSGIFDAQNKGSQLSNGQYILFLNSGDILANNQVINKFNNFKANSDLIIGDIIFDLGKYQWRRYFSKQINDIFFFLESLPHSSTFIKRELLEECDGYDLSYKIVSDYDFFIKSTIKLKSSYTFMKTPISVFNKMGISSDESADSNHIKERNEVFIKYFGHERFDELNKKRTYYNLFYKKIPYIYNFIKSYFELN